MDEINREMKYALIFGLLSGDEKTFKILQIIFKHLLWEK